MGISLKKNERENFFCHLCTEAVKRPVVKALVSAEVFRKITFMVFDLEAKDDLKSNAETHEELIIELFKSDGFK